MARLIKNAKKQMGSNKPVIAGKTEVRNTPIPKSSAPATLAGTATAAAPKASVSQEQIARRAYEIWASGKGGSDFENWVRAERELRGR